MLESSHACVSHTNWFDELIQLTHERTSPPQILIDSTYLWTDTPSIHLWHESRTGLFLTSRESDWYSATDYRLSQVIGDDTALSMMTAVIKGASTLSICSMRVSVAFEFCISFVNVWVWENASKVLHCADLIFDVYNDYPELKILIYPHTHTNTRRIAHNTKQAQRRAAAETVSRKLIEHFIHLMHNSSRHHNCWIYHDFELMCLTRKND